MQDKREELMELCRQAKDEADSTKLMELVKRIDKLCEEIYGKLGERRKAS